MFQESSHQPEVSVLQLGEALVPTEEHRGIVMCISWGTRTPSWGCTVASWCLFLSFYIPSLPWEANVWICPWNSGRPRRLNEAYFLQTRNGGHRKDLYPGGPHLIFVFVQSLSCVWLFVTPWATSHQASLSFTIFQSLLKLMSIESVMLSNHLILFCPLLLFSVFPRIRVFSSKSALCIRWLKY